MLKIRLQRVGRKHEPTFRVVLTDSENSTKSGRLKEVLGSYDPRKTKDLLKTDRIRYWLEKGALPTGTAHNLFVTHKIIDAPKINVLPRKKPIVKEVKEEPVTADGGTPQNAVATEPVVESSEVTADGGTPQAAVAPSDNTEAAA